VSDLYSWSASFTKPSGDHRRMTFRRKNAVDKIAKIEALLRAEPMTVKQIAEKLHISKKTSHVYNQHLRPLLHIAKWSRELTGPPAPMFAWGPGKDAKRPRAMTGVEKTKAYRKRLRTERPEAWMDKVNKERAARLKPYRSPLDAAFFGAGA